MQLLIYTSSITPRKEYIFDFIFNQILGVPYLLSGDAKAFLEYDGPKISYTTSALTDELYFEETGLLSQTGIVKSALSFTKYDDYEVPFAIAPLIFPFDVFAASFYLISRYEEYLNPEKDEHGRFVAKSSMAYQKGFLARPVIDEWVLKLLYILKKRFPDLKHKTRRFIFQPTLDIDRAYYLRTEKPLREFLKTIKLMVNTEWKALVNDPFDVYQQVAVWDQEYTLKTMFFMLMNNKHVHDGRESKKGVLFKRLVQNLDKNFVLGLHPSYSSNTNEEELSLEKTALEDLISKGVYVSRQHYLKLSFPDTYRKLLKNNIKEDYTMAYADLPGFRASTCSPFLWYDLLEEKVTDLFIQPTTVMDQTLRSYMGLSPAEALEQLKTLMQNVKNVNGTFVSLWHNESVSDFDVWKHWKKVYIELLKMSKL